MTGRPKYATDEEREAAYKASRRKYRETHKEQISERGHRYYETRKERIAEYHRKRREKRRAAGLCIRCGKPSGSYAYCFSCRLKDFQRREEKKAHEQSSAAESRKED